MNNKSRWLIISRGSIILPVLYMVFIFILSSIPANEDKLAGYIYIRPTIQNLLHIPLFGLLAFLWMKAFDDNKLQFKKALIYTLIITALYAAFDEFHQSFVPGRFASFGDFLLNTIGYIGGIFTYRLAALLSLRASKGQSNLISDCSVK